MYFLKPMTNSFLKLELKYKLKLFITLGLQEVLQSPLRRKKGFMKGFFKKRAPQNEQYYETYKNLFKTIKKQQRKYNAPTNYLNVQGILKTWNVMKDIIGKSRNLPRKPTIKPKQPMLLMISLLMLMRDWPFKYLNHVKHLKHISIR